MISQALPRAGSYPQRLGRGDKRAVGQFMGTHQNRVDAKGRVSIPAPFRAILRGGAPEGAVSAVLRPSHLHPCIEVWPVAVFESLGEHLERMSLFSADHEDLADALFGDAQTVESDREGRIVLPERMARHACVSDTVVFMGQGQSFRIWEPVAAEKRRAEARARALEKGLTLPAPGAFR